MRLRRRPTPPFVAAAVLLLLLLTRIFSPPHQPPEDVFSNEPVVVRRVVDGDTLLLESGQRVRLIGVDTPESVAPDRPVEWLGPEASDFTRRMIGDEPVRLEFDRERRDEYHRLLAYVHLMDGRLLNEELIRAGFSAAKTRYPYRNDRKRQFLEAEAAAQKDRLGIWGERPEK